jgi:hypothetical protein
MRRYDSLAEGALASRSPVSPSAGLLSGLRSRSLMRRLGLSYRHHHTLQPLQAAQARTQQRKPDTTSTSMDNSQSRQSIPRITRAPSPTNKSISSWPQRRLSASSSSSSSPYTPSPSSSPTTPIETKASWAALFLLALSYVHQSTTGFSLPAMLPAIQQDLQLNDLQGAFLTTGYSYLYALALLPIGLIADRVPRPALLAAGIASWSSLTLLASHAQSFTELLTARVGFAAAQAVQNPIAFALIPDLFPRNKSAALALYKCVYLSLSRCIILVSPHNPLQLCHLPWESSVIRCCLGSFRVVGGEYFNASPSLL